MKRPIRQRPRRISRWILYQQKLNFINDEKRNQMEDLEEDGATAVPAAMAPWAMKKSQISTHPYRK